MRKGSLKRWCRYIAVTLGVPDSAYVDKISDAVMAKLDTADESSVIAACILTRRMCQKSKPKFWTYSKPNNTPPQIEEITESAAAMHCIDIDSLDILLLCNCLEYDFNKASDFLEVQNVKEKYIVAMHKLLDLIEFEANVTPEQKENTVLTVMQGIGDEIRLFASKKAIAYFMKQCAVNTYQAVKKSALYLSKKAMLLGKNIISFVNSTTSDKNPKVTTSNISTADGKNDDKFTKALKSNLKKSIIAFAVLDSIVIISLLIFWVASQGIFDANKKNEYQHTLDNANGGIYYELTYLPSGYRLSEHVIAPLSAKAIYTDSSNNQIIFSQIVSEKEVKSFKNAKHYSFVQEDNRKIAVLETQSSTELYWFNKNYTYTLTTSLEKDITLNIAKGIQLSVDDILPMKYTEYLADENDNIIVDEVDNEDRKEISGIIESFTKGEKDSIRIANYDGDYPEIITVTVDKGYVYCKKDARRISNGEQEFEIGKAYDSLEIISARNNKSSLVAKEIDTGKQMTLITF